MARARGLAKVLGAKPTYRRLLADRVDRRMEQVRYAFRDREAGSAAEGVARNAVVGINAYQVWDDVLSDGDTTDTAVAVAFSAVLVGCVGGAIHYVSGGFSLGRIVAGVGFAVVAATVGVVTFFVGGGMASLRFPPARRVRSACAILLLGGGCYGALYLYRWDGFWGDALFAGVASALAVLFLLAVVLQVSRGAIGAMYRHTWSTYPVEEIIESLSAALTYMEATSKSYAAPDGIGMAVWYQARAARTLNHIASCLERYLPAALGVADQRTLREAVLPDVLSAAAEMRLLARRWLMARPDTREELRAEIATRLVAATGGHWGAWGSTAPAEEAEAPGKGEWLRNSGNVLVKLTPLIVVAAGLVLVYRSDPRSALLEPEVVGPISAAAFAYLTTMIVNGINPRQTDPTRQGTRFKSPFGRAPADH